MIRLQLRIRTPWLDVQPDPEDPDQDPPPAESVYEAELLAGDVSADTSVSDGVLETGDVQVRVASSEIAGAASLLAMRPERLRAAVVDADTYPAEGSVVFAGTLERVGASCDDPAPGDGLRVWTLRLRETAREDVETALDSVSCRALIPALTALNDIVGLTTRIHDGDGNLRSETWDWTDLRSLVEQALSAAAGSPAAVPVPELGVYYGADGLARLPVRLGVATARGTVPDWTGTEAWAVWRGLMGARLVARYADYPGTARAVRVEDGRWTEPETAPPAYEALDGYDVSAEPADRPGLRLELGQAMYNGEAGYAPPAVAYAAGPPSGEAETVELFVPRVVESGAVARTSGDYSETLTVGYPLVDRVADEIGEARPGQPDPADGHVYLVALVETPGGPRALAYRTPDDPPPATRGPSRVNEAWAASLYANHQMRAWETFALQIEIDLDQAIADGYPLPEIGTAVVGVSADGAAWAVTEMRVDADTRRAEITAVRPSRALVDPYATSGGLSPGVYPEPNVYAVIRSEQAEGQSGPEGPVMYRAFAQASAAGADRVEMQLLTTAPAWIAYDGSAVTVTDGSDHRFFRARAFYDVYGVTTAWAYGGTDGSTTPPVGAPA